MGEGEGREGKVREWISGILGVCAFLCYGTEGGASLLLFTLSCVRCFLRSK